MKLIFLATISLIISNCNRQQTPPQKNDTAKEEIPPCIQKKIEQIKNEPVRNPPGSCWQYTYQNKSVYYFPSYCCDMMGEVYDAECRLICYPDGGITGKGDGKCTDFVESRGNGKLIWKDERQDQ